MKKYKSIKDMYDKVTKSKEEYHNRKLSLEEKIGRLDVSQAIYKFANSDGHLDSLIIKESILDDIVDSSKKLKGKSVLKISLGDKDPEDIQKTIRILEKFELSTYVSGGQLNIQKMVKE